jgi:hypothetical protein
MRPETSMSNLDSSAPCWNDEFARLRKSTELPRQSLEGGHEEREKKSQARRARKIKHEKGALP